MDNTDQNHPEKSPGHGQEHSAGILPPSANRVPAHTACKVQERIRLSTVDNIARTLSSPQQINSRITELDSEWDVERILELNASLLALSGVLLGKFHHRKWFYLSIAVTGFLAQHAVQGWCPPLPILRRLGVRTRKEIEQERNALKMVRGDFKQMPEQSGAWERAEELLRVQKR
ncbi:MAG: hypothetical protein RBT36_03390 [Desulfobulbus sp.]|jgi:hypothetical protein|nr:hypothetical protein [Desulfobulbus sp.]